MIDYVKYGVLLVVLIIIQKVFIPFIDVTSYSVTPDIVLIGLVYAALKKGKTFGSVAGFLSGLVIDFISFSFLGLMALSKATAGFVAGFFARDESKLHRYLSSYIFVIIVVFCSVVHNFIYYFIYFQGGSLGVLDIILRYVIPTSIYTGIFAIFPVIFERRRKVR